jgi:hypothetical protein
MEVGTIFTKEHPLSMPSARRRAVFVGLAALTLLAAGALMRIHFLGLPFDRDSYDEGVYWQSLRAIGAGLPLYREIFYSQPPAFLLSVLPAYLLFGQTLWSARLGIAIVSLFGLLGALLLGKALGRQIGALAALLLLVADPLYLAPSRTLQAEGPAIALSLLAVGLAYLWWKTPRGRTGFVLAILAAVALSLGILCKLLVASALVPIGLLAIGHLYRVCRQPDGGHASAHSLLAGAGAFILTTLLVLIPFHGSFPELWQGVVTFHLRAGELSRGAQAQNLGDIQDFLLATPTTYAALCGTAIALLRRDWRLIPLVAWLIATLYLLWAQTPLFPHHLTTLTPILVALAAEGFGSEWTHTTSSRAFQILATTIVLLAVLAVSTQNLQATRRYYWSEQAQAADATLQSARVISDLQEMVGPNQLVVTDAQFVAGLADRTTPASLVDSSMVRISAGYLSAEQLIREASRPEVQAVLFYTGRLKRDQVAAFGDWVTQHFRLVRSYGERRELWVKSR